MTIPYGADPPFPTGKSTPTRNTLLSPANHIIGTTTILPAKGSHPMTPKNLEHRNTREEHKAGDREENTGENHTTRDKEQDRIAGIHRKTDFISLLIETEQKASLDGNDTTSLMEVIKVQVDTLHLMNPDTIPIGTYPPHAILIDRAIHRNPFTLTHRVIGDITAPARVHRLLASPYMHSLETQTHQQDTVLTFHFLLPTIHAPKIQEDMRHVLDKLVSITRSPLCLDPSLVLKGKVTAARIHTQYRNTFDVPDLSFEQKLPLGTDQLPDNHLRATLSVTIPLTSLLE